MPNFSYISAAPRERVKRFYRAVEQGDLNKVREYLSPDLINKQVVNKQDHRQIPLHIAAKNGHYDVVHFLVEQGVDVDSFDERMTTALILAVVYDHHDIAMFLASHGANIRHADWMGRTAYFSYLDPILQEQLRQASISFAHRNEQHA